MESLVNGLLLAATKIAREFDNIPGHAEIELATQEALAHAARLFHPTKGDFTARAIGVAPCAINEIIHARRSITPAMAIRFGAFFGQSAEFWHGIHVECDFRALAKDQQKLTAHIQPAITIARAS